MNNMGVDNIIVYVLINIYIYILNQYRVNAVVIKIKIYLKKVSLFY